MTIKKHAIAFALAGTLAAGGGATALAGPLPVNPGVKSATTDHVTDVRWRGHGGWGWGPAVGIGAGLAAGALIGSAVAAQPYGYYYNEPAYAYTAPGYGYATPYAYDVGPTYVAPGPYYGYGYRGWGRCFTDEGYGRRVPCDTTGQR